MFNIVINVSLRRFPTDLLLVSLFLFQSFSDASNASATSIVSAICGTNVELTCPIRSIKDSEEVISWFRPNASANHHLSFISIGDILLPEYAVLGRYNLLSSSSAVSRLAIHELLIEDQGFYKCKSSAHGHHTVHLLVHSQPHLSPDSPILLYPVNRTFSITCSLLCESNIDLDQLLWLVNGHALTADPSRFHLETLSFNSQRLTVLLNKKTNHFSPTNYTCRYKEKESNILVRRRTKEELHRLPRQPGSSSAYLLQTASFDTGHRHSQSSHHLLLIFPFLFQLLWCAAI